MSKFHTKLGFIEGWVASSTKQNFDDKANVFNIFANKALAAVQIAAGAAEPCHVAYFSDFTQSARILNFAAAKGRLGVWPKHTRVCTYKVAETQFSTDIERKQLIWCGNVPTKSTKDERHKATKENHGMSITETQEDRGKPGRKEPFRGENGTTRAK